MHVCVSSLSPAALLNKEATCTKMSLVGLLEKVPALLQACVGDEMASLKRLRLVSKEFCKLALLALKTYTLTLHGSENDTNACGSRLLRQAQLQCLHVSLALSGVWLKHNADEVVIRPSLFLEREGQANHPSFEVEGSGLS